MQAVEPAVELRVAVELGGGDRAVRGQAVSASGEQRDGVRIAERPAESTDPPGDMPGRREGRWLGLPYDWRRPTRRRILERSWNPRDPRLLTPKAYGWGLGINAYRLAHPLRWRAVRRR
jgi:hypothetical protein